MTTTTIIGGGLGGLACATYLARAGHRVTLLEASNALGGRGRTQVRDGFHFNLGPHALYLGGHAFAVLRELGIAAPGGKPSLRRARALTGGRVYQLPAGPGSLMTTGLLSWSAKMELGRFLGRLPKLDAGALTGTTRAWLDATFRQPDARALIEALIRLSTYADRPERMPAALGVSQLQLSSDPGVRYVDGGWATLVDGLAEAAEAAGVELRIGAPAAAVRPEGVALKDGSLVPGEAVVLAVGPERASRLCGRPLRRPPEPILAACLDVALDRLPGRDTFLLGIDRSVYASVHSNVARLAPGDGAVVQLYRLLEAEAALRPTPAELQQEMEEALDRLQPGWRAHELERRFLPRMVAAHDLPAVGEVAPLLEPPPGVHLVGDWVGGSGWLLDASLRSARDAARAISGSAVRAA